MGYIRTGEWLAWSQRGDFVIHDPGLHTTTVRVGTYRPYQFYVVLGDYHFTDDAEALDKYERLVTMFVQLHEMRDKNAH